MMTTDPAIGLQRETVRVVPADPSWPELFRAEADRLTDRIAAAKLPALTFEHIGSTGETSSPCGLLMRRSSNGWQTCMRRIVALTPAGKAAFIKSIMRGEQLPVQP